MHSRRTFLQMLNIDATVATDAEIGQERLKNFRAKLNANLDAPSAHSISRSEQEKLDSFLTAVFSGSRYLYECAIRFPQDVTMLATNNCDDYFDGLLTEATCDSGANAMAATEAAFKEHLRIIKNRAAMVIALADLGGVWDLNQVTGRLSSMADTLLRMTLNWCLKQELQQGRLIAEPQAAEVKDTSVKDAGSSGAGQASTEQLSDQSGIVIFALGKFGALELNYSSDIDLIVFYEEEIDQISKKMSPPVFYGRLMQRVIKLLQEQTKQGYVYRCDLRLRPDPNSTPIAINRFTAMTYYARSGQNWERAALIKARSVAGNLALGQEMLDELRPFIWRRHLDYGALDDIRLMKRRINLHRGATSGAREEEFYGYDLKLDPGGIREIEFFTQAQQLIAGGREPELRTPRTEAGLQQLCSHGWISAQARDSLIDCYRELRRLEHRVQMQNDAQSHKIPASPEECDVFSRFAGYANAKELFARLAQIIDTVTRHYEKLFSTEEADASPELAIWFGGSDINPEALDFLSQAGFKNTKEVLEIIKVWYQGGYRSLGNNKARQALGQCLPRLIRAIAVQGAGDEAIRQLDRLLRAMPTGLELFSLLRENQSLFEIFATILGAAPKLAARLAEYPHIVDGLLEVIAPGNVTALQELGDHIEDAFNRHMASAGSYEDKLNLGRIVTAELKFIVSAEVLRGRLGILDSGRVNSAIADQAIKAMFELSLRNFISYHGTVANTRFAIIALGKLGGQELGQSSDLDLVLLYDADAETSHSDGANSLAQSTYFARLAQRFVTSLSGVTPRGIMYDVDMRLRPSGVKGSLAVSKQAFEHYIRNEAWTWELMAATRARFVHGDPEFGAEIRSIIKEKLIEPRDEPQTLGEVTSMRARIAKHKPSRGSWDLKLAPGGILDIEFALQSMQLIHAHHAPDIINGNCITVIEKLNDHHLLTPDMYTELSASYSLLIALTQLHQMCDDQPISSTTSPGLKRLLAQAANEPDFERLTATITQRQQAVINISNQLLGKARN